MRKKTSKKIRERIMRNIETMREQGHSIQAACKIQGIHSTTYFKWKRESNNDESISSGPKITIERIQELEATEQRYAALKAEHEQAIQRIVILEAFVKDVVSGRYNPKEIDLDRAMVNIALGQYQKSKA